MRRPYANRTLQAINDALIAPDMDAERLEPELERKARDIALRAIQEPGNRWRSFDSLLSQARRIVQSGDGATP